MNHTLSYLTVPTGPKNPIQIYGIISIIRPDLLDLPELGSRTGPDGRKKTLALRLIRLQLTLIPTVPTTPQLLNQDKGTLHIRYR